MDLMSVTWWMWVLAGLILMALEVLTPGGFFVFFFGAGAMLVGLLDLMGLHLSFPAQGLVFVGASVGAIVVLRKPAQELFQPRGMRGKVDSIVGETAQTTEEIPIAGIGKAELRGASWNVRNIGDKPIPRLARCRVESVDGLTLNVRF
jgi:membrane protein implicated in regulation of membrane protease activity